MPITNTNTATGGVHPCVRERVMSNVVVAPNVELARQSSVVSQLPPRLLTPFRHSFFSSARSRRRRLRASRRSAPRAPLAVVAATADNGPHFPHFPTTCRRNEHTIASFGH